MAAVVDHRVAARHPGVPSLDSRLCHLGDLGRAVRAGGEHPRARHAPYASGLTRLRTPWPPGGRGCRPHRATRRRRGSPTRSSGPWVATGNHLERCGRPGLSGRSRSTLQPTAALHAAVSHGRDPDPAPPCSSARGRRGRVIDGLGCLHRFYWCRSCDVYGRGTACWTCSSTRVQWDHVPPAEARPFAIDSAARSTLDP